MPVEHLSYGLSRSGAQERQVVSSLAGLDCVEEDRCSLLFDEHLSCRFDDHLDLDPDPPPSSFSSSSFGSSFDQSKWSSGSLLMGQDSRQAMTDLVAGQLSPS